jgi:hypothetical protein
MVPQLDVLDYRQASGLIPPSVSEILFPTLVSWLHCATLHTAGGTSERCADTVCLCSSCCLTGSAV